MFPVCVRAVKYCINVCVRAVGAGRRRRERRGDGRWMQGSKDNQEVTVEEPVSMVTCQWRVLGWGMKGLCIYMYVCNKVGRSS